MLNLVESVGGKNVIYMDQFKGDQTYLFVQMPQWTQNVVTVNYILRYVSAGV